MKLIALELLTKHSVQLLRKLCGKARFATTYTLSAKQNELSAQLGMSRQSYNVRLRKLKTEVTFAQVEAPSVLFKKD